jgi:hypothetical protein
VLESNRISLADHTDAMHEKDQTQKRIEEKQVGFLPMEIH